MALFDLKGTQLGQQRVQIERGPVRVFAQAILDENPVYQSDGAPVPPTFPFVMPYWGSLGQGGAAGLPIEKLRGKGRAILHGEQEFLYHDGEWPHVGDILVGDGVIADVYEKPRSRAAASSSSMSPRPRGGTSERHARRHHKFTLAINCKPDAADPKPPPTASWATRRKSSPTGPRSRTYSCGTRGRSTPRTGTSSTRSSRPTRTSTTPPNPGGVKGSLGEVRRG